MNVCIIVFVNPSFTGGGGTLNPPLPTTYDETLCKFLYHTCGNSYALIWSKKIYFRTFYHTVSKDRRVQNRDFCTCQFRVLKGIFWALFMNQKLFRIKKYMRNHQKKF